MIGSRMYVYKQDPSIKEPGLRSTFIPSEVLKGPKDQLVRIADVPEITPDENGDFLIDLVEDKQTNLDKLRLQFDAVHTFAVCRQVLTMYERAFYRMGILKEEDKNERGIFDFRKKWGKRLDLYIRAEKGKLSARYTSGVHTIFFGYKKDVFTCRSFDIIAHETGHAVLNAIRGEQKTNHSKEAIALDEAFCDLTAIFTLLSQMDMCEAIIAHSKGDLRTTDDFFFSCIAEEYGVDKYKRFALRDISKKYKYETVVANKKYDQYDLSLVFSSAVYHFLTEVFKDHFYPEKYDPAETLFWLGKMITEVTLGAYYEAASELHYDFKTIAKKMISLVQKVERKEYHDCLNKKRRWEIRLLKIFIEHEVL